MKRFDWFIVNAHKLININVTENTEVIKPPEQVDDFLSSLFKALYRQKSKDDRKIVEKKVTIFL